MSEKTPRLRPHESTEWHEARMKALSTPGDRYYREPAPGRHPLSLDEQRLAGQLSLRDARHPLIEDQETRATVIPLIDEGADLLADHSPLPPAA